MRFIASHRSFSMICSISLALASGCQKAPAVPGSAASPASDAPATKVEVADVDTPFDLEEGFELLGFDHFEAFGAEADTWKSDSNGIVCSGKPRGYLYSKTPYANFTLQLEYRFPRPQKLTDESKFKGNTGFLVYISGEHKLWPICLEVQGKHVQMAAIKENGGADPVTVTDDDANRQKARKPVGQWNALEIVSKEGALSVSLNGTPISNSQAGPLKSGAIGIQAEDHPFTVRRIRIRKD